MVNVSFVYRNILQNESDQRVCVCEGGVDIGDRVHRRNLAMAVSGMLG